MHTTLREKLLLWSNGLILALSVELLRHSNVGPASPEALTIIISAGAIMAAASALILRRPSAQ